MYAPVGVRAGVSSLDIEPSSDLDPDLFVGTRLRSSVRMDLLGLLNGYMTHQYRNHERWMRAWIAGSAASFRWHASHAMRDLDVLLGVDFVGFRSANPGYTQMSNAEIASHLNEGLRMELWPATSAWQGQYEVTWYVNPGSWDITAIKPYAAYDLVEDGWTVPPSPDAPRVDPQWAVHADMYHQRANTIVERYSQSLTTLQNATNPAARVNAERMFHMTVEQAVGMFESVHAARRTAFAGTGEGYDDWGNYLWQMGKKAGWLPALRQIKDYHESVTGDVNLQTYGIDLPSTDTMIRRAAMHNR
jgi:hypothetical protein